jgi:hypothetical protein
MSLSSHYCSTIAYVDPNIDGKWVSVNNAHLFSGHSPANDKSIHLIVTSIIDMTIWSIMKDEITGL